MVGCEEYCLDAQFSVATSAILVHPELTLYLIDLNPAKKHLKSI